MRRPSAPRDDTWSRARRRPKPRRTRRYFGRTLVALLSAAVLGFSGYAWATLRTLNAGLAGSDVIDNLNAPDGATDILLVGNDSRTDAQGNPLPEHVLRELRTTAESGNLTDTMILVRIPNGGGRASAVSFPRDTQVRLDHGYGKHLLTEAFNTERIAELHRLENAGVSDPRERERRARTAGQKFLINTIEDLSGVAIDHYAEVNLLGFYEITQAVGGVEVCLRHPVDDHENSGAVFNAGRQTISGGDALAFVRQRHHLLRGDLDRVRRQQVFLSGLAQKILSAGTLGNPAKLSELVEALSRSVVLDRGWDVLGFAQQMQGIAGGAIEFQTIPVELVGTAGQEEVTADKSEVRRFVADLLLPPRERAVRRQAAEQAEQARPAQPPDITASVYNASGATGLAADVSKTLTAQGFDPGQIGNAEARSSSVVRVAPGELSSGERVATALGGLPVQESASVPSGQVQVYLGSDYSGPGAHEFAGPPPLRLDGPAVPRLSQQPPQDEPITADGVTCVN